MFLLTIQGFLIILFTMTGFLKVTIPKKKFKQKMPWAKKFTDNQIVVIGIFEVLGAAGLVLPLWLDTLTWLTPLGAIGLATVSFSAFLLHKKRKETGGMVFAGLVSAAAIYVAWNYLHLLGL